MVPDSQDLKIAEEKAFERARIVAALISMSVLSSGSRPVSCGLTREVNDNFYDSIRFDNPGWNLNFEQRERVQYTRPGQPISRAELLAVFQHIEFRALAVAILGPNCPLTGRMRLKITSSLLRLASGVWANEAKPAAWRIYKHGNVTG